jgi:AraC-like DNA-binding protein
VVQNRLQTTLRISEIAFEDAKYFRKAFQKHYNLTPSHYARQHRPGAGPAPATAGTAYPVDA